MNPLWWAQIRAVVRLEMRKTFLRQARPVDLPVWRCAGRPLPDALAG